MTTPLRLCISCQKPVPFGANYCPTCGQHQKNTGSLSVGERRLVTILFADLASFTAVSENSDPEDVIDMLNYVFTRLMVECEREGGYLDKTVGDQLMVLFGAPRAHEDDPARAVRAALGMQAAMEELAPIMRNKVGAVCKLNIGVHTGNVVWGQSGPTGHMTPTVIGDAVNLAARLQTAAKGGQIFVSEAVYLRTRHLFEYQIFEPITVKNKSGVIPIYSPLYPHQPATTGTDSMETTVPLIERDQELQTFHAYWSRAIAGYPQMVLLRGDAGMGKSRLLAEFARSLDSYAAGKQPLILHAQCKSSARNNYQPLANLLQQLFGLSAEDTELIRRRKVEDRARILSVNEPRFLPLMGYLLGWYRDDPRLATLEANIASLQELALETAANLFLKQSTHRPIMLIIDDLHLAQLETLKWLNLIALGGQDRLSENWRMSYQLMVLAASRPQTETQAELPPMELVSLAPLNDLARREVIKHLLPGEGLPLSLIERLSRTSEGNPFYLIEAARNIIQSKQLVQQDGVWHLACPDSQLEMPQSVEGLMMANLDALDPVTRMVLQYAAVIGVQFNYSLLADITPVEALDQHLADLEQHGLILEVDPPGPVSEQVFSFTHKVMREVAYQGLLRKTRRELHNRIAQLSELEASPNREEIKALAYHYAASGEQEKLIAYNWMAGQRALNEFKFEDAHHYLQRAWVALQKMPDPNKEVHQNLATALGDASTFTGDFPSAAICYQVALELVGDNVKELAFLHYRLGRLHFYQVEVEVANKHYKEALKLAPFNETLKSQIEAELRLLYDMS